MKEEIAAMIKKVKDKKTQQSGMTKFSPVAGKVVTTVLLSAALSGVEAATVNESNKDVVNNNKNELVNHGIYNGLKIYYEDFDAVELGHIFESKLNPLARSANGKYLGLYQMDTGQTMQSFLESVKDKYPELYRKGSTAVARKQQAFLNEWKKLSTGEKAKEFSQDQYRFMNKEKYEPVFEKLRSIPGLDIDKRGKVLEGAMMSAINQFSATNVVKFAKQAIATAQQRALKNKRNDVPTAYIIDGFYKARTDFVNSSTRMSEAVKKSLKMRFKEENKLAQDILKYHEHQEKKKNMEANADSKTYQITLDELNKAAPLSPVLNLARSRKTNTL